MSTSAKGPNDHFKRVQQSLSPNSPYEEIVRKVQPMLVKSGGQCLNQDEPLFRLVLFAQETSFALLFSLSHVLADGFTFYSLYGQLSLHASPRAHADGTTTERVHSYPALCGNAVGEAKEAWLGTPDVFVGMQHSWREKLHFDIFHLNDAWITEQKRKRAGQAFLSTNDVLTSWFLSAGGFIGYGIMAINCRDRLSATTRRSCSTSPRSLTGPPGFARRCAPPPRVQHRSNGRADGRVVSHAALGLCHELGQLLPARRAPRMHAGDPPPCVRHRHALASGARHLQANGG